MSETRELTGQQPEAAPGELLKVEDLAKLLKVSEAWVRKGVLERTLPYTKIGRNVRFTPTQVQQIILAGERPERTRPTGPPSRGSARTRL